MERWQRDLDNYITGGRYRKWTEELQCKKCGLKWNARFEEEYGMCQYIDDDNLCPDCGADYEDTNDPEGLAH